MRYTPAEMASPTETVPAAAEASRRRAASVSERVGSLALACLFLFGAAVQYNDPDPLRWMAIYLAAAAVSAGHALRPMSALPGAIVATAALIWAILWAPSALATLPAAADIASDVKMMSPGVEEVRELLGLVIIAVAMIVLSIRARLANKRRTQAA